MEKFLARPIPNQASSQLREYLQDQISRMQILLNGAALREEKETITGDWTFSGSLTIPQASVTDHQAALTILETQITDGSLLARVAENETISGTWIFNKSGNSTTTPAIALTGTAGYISFGHDGGLFNCRLTGDGQNSVPDDATFTVPFGAGQTEGFVMVWTTSSVGEWFFGFLNPNGTFTAIQEGVNTVSGNTNPDTDGLLNVFPSGSGGISVKNRRGANRHIRVMLFGT